MLSFSKATNWLSELLFGDSASRYVTPQNAIKYPPIWYAVNKIGGHVGQLPLTLYRRTEQGRGAEPATSHPAYRLLKVAPNSWQTPVVFKELLQVHALLWGNAYAWIRKENGRPVELIPLYPGRTAPELTLGVKTFIHLPHNGDDAIMRYMQPGNKDGGYLEIDDSEILHIPGLGFDGYAGQSLWKVASDSWSIGLESDNRIKNGFQKGFKAAMLLEAPSDAFRTPEQAKQFIDDFNAYHSGSENADKAGLLTRGITANVTQMNSQEAQMVEHRRYQRQDSALWFLLESILGDDSSVSYNSLEQKNLAYLSNCLMRWLVKWEEECNKKLLAAQSNLYYFKFNTGALLRADHKTTIESLSLGITARIYSPNEARQKLDMNPYEGGDEYENPAITPGSPGGEQDAEEVQPEEPQEKASLATIALLEHMLGVEASRAAALTRKDNFLDAVDKFYGQWENKLSAVFGKCGLNKELATDHCDKSREMLLDCAGSATTQGELQQVVDKCVENWKSRAGSLLCQNFA